MASRLLKQKVGERLASVYSMSDCIKLENVTIKGNDLFLDVENIIKYIVKDLKENDGCYENIRLINIDKLKEIE